MAGDNDALAVLAEIEAEQLRLREMLAGWSEPLLAERPPSGKWSVLENVRHLLFAEQSHLGRFRAGGREWSPLGLPPHNMEGQRQLQAMTGETAAGLTEVLDAWAEAHAAIRAGIEEEGGAAAAVLDRHLRHLRAHIKVIERQLRTAGKG